MSQVEIAGFAAGSLVVTARATDLVDAEAAQATARSIEAKAFAGKLVGPDFGHCTVVHVAAEAAVMEVTCDAQYDVVYDSEKLQVGAKVLLKKIDYRGRVKVIPVLVESARYRPSVQQMLGLLAGQTKIDDDFKEANPEEESDELGVVCYVCGARVMNLETYDAHLENCLTRWQRLEDRKPRGERRAPPKPPAEVPRPPALSDVEATVAYNDKVEEERVDDGSNPNGGGVPAAELELEERINLRTHRVQMEKVQQHTEEGLIGQVRKLALAETMLAKHQGYKKPALPASAASYGVDGAAGVVGFGGGKGPPEQRTKLMEARSHRLYEERRMETGGWVAGADEDAADGQRSALSARAAGGSIRHVPGGREGAYLRPKKEAGFRR
uniref:Uncharacterized protein n=1 Tax=Florenciella parvula TaxID=236787 RepID=A0A7S2G961_9STRA